LENEQIIDMKKKLLAVFIISIVSCACNSRSKFYGLWVIDKLSIDNQDRKFQMLANSIEFDKNNECRLPTLKSEESEIGQWYTEPSENGMVLNISAKNSPFTGAYSAVFKKGIGVNDTIEMSSGNIYMRCIRIID
jgi:hypothetical protein